MSRKLYYAARPETLVSIIINGTLPGNLPEYAKQDGIQLFEDAQFAIENSTALKKNIFILEYELPEDSSQYFVNHIPDKNVTFISTEKLDKAALRYIYVLNQTAQKLVNNLLNSKSPVEIKVEPTIYSSSNYTTQPIPLVGVVNTPNQLVTYIKTGDLLGSKMQTLVNTVNCVGVMGKGIALSFKQRFPEMFDDYKKRCSEKQVKLGVPYVYPAGERLIVNFPTKGHWKNASELSWVEAGLKYLAANASQWGIQSMAIPPLGCGNGGLNWEDVLPLVKKYLLPLKVPLEIYEPFEKTNQKKRKNNPSTTNQGGLKQTSLSSIFQPEYQKDSENENGKVKKRKINQSQKFVYEYDQHDTIRVLEVNTEIGHLKVELDAGYYWLDHIEIGVQWRRQGIGTQLIKEAVLLFPQLQIPLLSAKEGYDGNYKYRLNEDVEKLIYHCLTLGIIDKAVNCSKLSPKFNVHSLKML